MEWEVAAVERLKVMASEGASGSKLAAALGVTRCAAIAKARRLGIRLAGTPFSPHAGGRPKSIKPEPPPPPPIFTDPISLLDIPFFGRCKFIADELVVGQVPMCCGASTEEDQSYCPTHYKLCYMKVRKRSPEQAASDYERGRLMRIAKNKKRAA